MALAHAHPSTADRALALRMRSDLDIRAQRHGRDRQWAVKDPVSLKYFHLREEEYTILEMLDGDTSLGELRRRCERVFAPRKFTLEQLHGFLATLHRYGLVLAESPGQGQELLARQKDARRRRKLETLLGLLAIRFRGVNPARLLDWLEPKFGWVFSPACVAASLLLALVAMALVTVEFDAFLARLPDFHSIVAASNLPWLLVALAVIKVLHELGHALACRRFGGDCHEIGIMLLVFTPSFYCNVSDSWMLQSKWQRIAIAAAGMYVELILASACTLLWWFSAPGLFNALCLNTMLICSIGTLVLNGNPLLRYDGYYILSDLVEVPNLSAQSTAAARRMLARCCFGIDLGHEGVTTTRREALLVAYAIISAVYRWAVVIAVLWTLNLIARPHHLEPLVVAAGCLTVIGMLTPAVTGIARLARDPARRRRFAPARAAATGIFAMIAALLVVLLPVPMRVAAPLVVEYRDAHRAYVTVPGKLVECAGAGQTVKKGQTLARLASPSVEMEVARLTNERERQRLFLENLEARRLQGVADGARAPAAKAALADIDERLGQLKRDAAELEIVAPVDGTVLPPPSIPRTPREDNKLAIWSGTPLDKRNLGSYLETGTLVCLVGSPNHFEAVLHIAQNDVELVEPGQRVRIVLDHLPGQVFWGEVVEIARLDLEVMPRELAAAGDLPARTDERGLSRPLDTWYQARVRFDRDPPRPLARVHGSAKISVASRSLGSQLVRYLKQTFSR